MAGGAGVWLGSTSSKKWRRRRPPPQAEAQPDAEAMAHDAEQVRLLEQVPPPQAENETPPENPETEAADAADEIGGWYQ